MQKTTEVLINELKSIKNVHKFINENTEELQELSLSAVLRELLAKYGIDKSEVFRKAGMSDNTYGYELFRNDEKKASRDKLIRICIGFPLTVEETQKVLRCGKVRPLYPRDERDAYILFALHKGFSLDELNDLLYEHELELFE